MTIHPWRRPIPRATRHDWAGVWSTRASAAGEDVEGVALTTHGEEPGPLSDGEEMTCAEVAAVLGISPSRVHAIELQALAKLREVFAGGYRRDRQLAMNAAALRRPREWQRRPREWHRWSRMWAVAYPCTDDRASWSDPPTQFYECSSWHQRRAWRDRYYRWRGNACR